MKQWMMALTLKLSLWHQSAAGMTITTHRKTYGWGRISMKTVKYRYLFVETRKVLGLYPQMHLITIITMTFILSWNQTICCWTVMELPPQLCECDKNVFSWHCWRTVSPYVYKRVLLVLPDIVMLPRTFLIVECSFHPFSVCVRGNFYCRIFVHVAAVTM